MFESDDEHKLINKLIETLPPRQKTVFLLSKKDGLSNSDISSKLNITKNTVENHLVRAKAILKKSLVNDYLNS